MALPRRLQDYLDTLAMFPDRQERIDALISTGERFRPVPEEVAMRPFSESNRVPGCESEAFVWSVPRGDGSLDFEFAVENPQGISAKALAVILKETLSGESGSSIENVPDELIYEIFGRELSMGKSMGLMNMVRMVKRLATNLRHAYPDG